MLFVADDDDDDSIPFHSMPCHTMLCHSYAMCWFLLLVIFIIYVHFDADGQL